MGEKKKDTPPQEPIKVIQPFEHDWTEPQICTLLARIAPDESYQQLFFLKHNKHTSKMVMQEQKLALGLLPNTDWMKFMIKEKRVDRIPEGGLDTREDWPKKMRVISRLFDVIHPLGSVRAVGYGDNDELVSAMMMLMIQELNDKRSNCMDNVAIAYEPPLNLFERAVLSLVIKMGGRLIPLGNRKKIQEFYGRIVGLEDKSAYILWKDTNNFEMMVDGAEANRDILPLPISLVGIVQMMVGNRKREMERGMVDLITF